MRRLAGIGVLTMALLGASAAGADLVYFRTPLGMTGDQEVPAKLVSGTGYGSGVLDTVADTLTVHMVWSGLTATATASHIHVGSGAGTNGPVAINFVGAGFPFATSGTYDHVFDLLDSATYGGGFLGGAGGGTAAGAMAAFVAGLTSNDAYFNIHTSVNPGGEIRGDIEVVPEPATMALFGLGLAGLVARRRLVRA